MSSFTLLPVCAGSNPQLDRLRHISSDVHVSLDDEEMREVDPDEHREALGAGIPQHLGQYVACHLINSIAALKYFISRFAATNKDLLHSSHSNVWDICPPLDTCPT